MGIVSMWAVVPVKDLKAAKQRLAGVLNPWQRRRLYEAMLTDVLAALSEVRGLEGVMMVTRDPDAAPLGRRFGATPFLEEDSRGQSQAVERAAAELRRRGARGMITLPGDVPLATAAEIEAVLQAHAPGRGTNRGQALTLVSNRHGEGSNSLACSPTDVIPFSFGRNSFSAHLAAARQAGIEANVLRLPGLELDVDTPEDLQTFLQWPRPRPRAAAGGTENRAPHTYAYLTESGLARRLRDPAWKAAPQLSACAAGGDCP